MISGRSRSRSRARARAPNSLVLAGNSADYAVALPRYYPLIPSMSEKIGGIDAVSALSWLEESPTICDTVHIP
jgi:hypothetical protein